MEGQSQENFDQEKMRSSFSEKHPGINLSNLDTNGDSEREAFRKRLDKSGVTESLIRSVEALMQQEIFPEDPMTFVTQFLSDCYLNSSHTTSSEFPSSPLLPLTCYCEHCLPSPNSPSTNGPTWVEMKAKLPQGRKPGRFSRRGSTALASLPENKSNEPTTSGLEVQHVTSENANSSDGTLEGKQGFEGTQTSQPVCISPDGISSTVDQNTDTRPIASPDYFPPRWGDTPTSSVQTTTLIPKSEANLCPKQGQVQAPTISPSAAGPMPSLGPNLCSTQEQVKAPTVSPSAAAPMLSSGPNLCSTQEQLKALTISPSVAAPMPSGQNLCSTQGQSQIPIQTPSSAVGTGGDGLFPIPRIPMGGHAGKSDSILATSIMEKKKLLKKIYHGQQNNEKQNLQQYATTYNKRAPQYVGPISHQQGPPNYSSTDLTPIPMGPPPHHMNNLGVATGLPNQQYTVAPPPLHYVFTNTGVPAPGLFSPNSISPMSSCHPSPLASPHKGSNGPAPFRHNGNPQPVYGPAHTGMNSVPDSNRNYSNGSKRNFEYHNPSERSTIHHHGKHYNEDKLGNQQDRSFGGRNGDKSGGYGSEKNYNNNQLNQGYNNNDAGDSQKDNNYSSTRQFHYNRSQHRSDSNHNQGRRNASGGYTKRTDNDKAMETYYGYRVLKAGGQGQGHPTLGAVFPAQSTNKNTPNSSTKNEAPRQEGSHTGKYSNKGGYETKVSGDSSQLSGKNSNLKSSSSKSSKGNACEQTTTTSTRESSSCVNTKCEGCQSIVD